MKALRLENGYFAVSTRSSGDTLIAGLFEVRPNYAITNDYLQNEFPHHDITASISLDSLTGATPVHGLNGRLLFYLIPATTTQPPTSSPGLLFLLIAALFATLLFINRLAASMRNRWLGLALLAASAAFIRWMVLVWFRPEFFASMELFSPRVYGTPNYAHSLGDLALTVMLALWICIFFFRHLHFFPKPAALRSLILIACNGMAGFLFILVTDIIRTLVLDSSISFDVRNILSLHPFSLFGIVCVALMLSSVFLLAFRVNAELPTDHGPGWRLLKLATGGMLALGAGYLAFPGTHWEVVMPATLLFLLIASEAARRRMMIISFNAILVLLGFFSFYTAWIIDNFNHDREDGLRSVYARRLLETNDPILEYSFADMKDEIKRDNLVRSYFLNPVVSTASLVDRLRYLYFGEQLSRYDVNVMAFSADTTTFRLLPSDSLAVIRMRIGGDSLPVPDDALVRVDTEDGSFEYWTILNIVDDNNLSVGRLTLQLKPKLISTSTVYPELLLEGRINTEDEFAEYGFALYAQGVLIKRSGDYPYQLRMDTESQGERTFGQDGYEHLVFTPRSGLTVWVSHPAEPWIEPVSLFSYVFSTFLVVTLLAAFIAFFTKLSRKRFDFRAVVRLTFRSKIQLAVTLIIVVSFLVIGTLTITNIIRQYDDYHSERLIRKVKQVLTGLELTYSPDSLHRAAADPLQSGLAEVVRNLSITHAMDVNIYNSSGRLVISSQPGIFDKGLVSRLIDPVAFQRIVTERKSQYIQTEHIGSLNFLSAYVPLNERNGVFTEILNLPYFAKERDLRNEISDFLVYFIDVYVLLLLVAGFVALVVSKSLTQPLQVIGGKLKQLQLGRPNAPIHWRGDDEIGQLVREYNKMIAQIEHGAQLLARSEREGAWREMAKQVAHEIKNPLTPMKLSIQHLQRAQQEGSPNLQEQVRKVSETLIEQIENLSRIASEFSAFATMPRADRKAMDLHETLRSVVTLYATSEIEFEARIPDAPATIFADKDQISRVFNNLIKNALQSIPDDRVGLIEVKSEVQGETVLVTISDNGVGIPAELAVHVFMPNFTTKTSGTGLGLTIAKNIVETSGGKIWFESTEGVGTQFCVSLPLTEQTHEP